jgi:hypothetical protein
MKAAVLAAAAAAGLAITAPAGAQTATVYRDANFSGPAVAVNGANPNMRLNFQVSSIRVGSGRWELCPEPNFRGRCLVVNGSDPNLRRSFGWPGPLQSMRVAGGGGWGGGAIGGQRLKGMASEFFPAPRRGNSRVLACANGSATAACAAQTADRFCQDAGWRGSARELMETENRRVYLADVLCVRTGY